MPTSCRAGQAGFAPFRSWRLPAPPSFWWSRTTVRPSSRACSSSESWIYAYVRRQSKDASDVSEGPLIVPACNLLAYALGALVLTQAALALRCGRGCGGAVARKPPHAPRMGGAGPEARDRHGGAVPGARRRDLAAAARPAHDPVHADHAVRGLACSRRGFDDFVRQLLTAALSSSPKPERCSRPFSAVSTRQPQRPSCWRAVRWKKG